MVEVEVGNGEVQGRAGARRGRGESLYTALTNVKVFPVTTVTVTGLAAGPQLRVLRHILPARAALLGVYVEYTQYRTQLILSACSGTNR